MKENALALLTDLYQGKQPSPLQKEAWEKFTRQGLPDQQTEAFQYLPWHRFYGNLTKEKEIALEEKIKVPLQEIVLVWKDGKFCPELSRLDLLPSSVVLLSLQEALLGSYAAFLRHRMQMMTEQETDPFALLNTALADEGFLLYIPPKTQVEFPIRVMISSCDSSVDYVGPKIHVFVGKNSQVQLIHSLDSKQKFLIRKKIVIFLDFYPYELL
jgi:hypothetical protein